ncbi:uncharacterized protein N7518_002783 [Penicillium psychrosexuale]|uniref:uncharacterized protein n=1 Tax=Penicillium psychrosexuale TaxID=1002107 RepID=UPI0025454036|nr:uncharacterized protein N7518_002783 [Penicillium psychrosexuale]KAJ5800715.1 hypothetical protein N7518_002783 [Penicillium psychrosexuale]
MSTLNKPAEPPVIPERISSLMAPSRQSALCTYKQRSVSIVSRLSEMSVDSITSDILELKLAVMESELEYIRCVRDVLKIQRLLIIEDIDKEVSAKRQRIEGLYTYRDAIISCMLGVSVKQKGPKFDQPAFKKGVYVYYGINEYYRPGFR